VHAAPPRAPSFEPFSLAKSFGPRAKSGGLAAGNGGAAPARHTFRESRVAPHAPRLVAVDPLGPLLTARGPPAHANSGIWSSAKAGARGDIVSTDSGPPAAPPS
jgi:hypothetical protein